MKRILLILLFSQLFIFHSVSQNSINNPELEKVWNQFSLSIINHNFDSLKNVSRDTIKCPFCAENTVEEQDLMSSIRKTKAYPDTLYSHLAKIPIERFFKEDLYNFCNENVLKIFIDKSKVSFTSHEKGKFEAHIIVNDSLYKEGLSYDFRFEEFNKNYKFTAFYTTP